MMHRMHHLFLAAVATMGIGTLTTIALAATSGTQEQAAVTQLAPSPRLTEHQLIETTPTPSALLRHADRLRLTVEQRKALSEADEKLRGEEARLAPQVIEKQAQFDEIVARGGETEAGAKNGDNPRLWNALFQLTKVQAEMRFAQLNAALAVRRAVPPDQLDRYWKIERKPPAAKRK